MQRSVLTVTSAASAFDLATVSRVKRELGLTDATYDDLIGDKLTAASKRIATYCNRVFARQTYSERFGLGCYSEVQLRQWPVTSISSVTLDDVAQTLTAGTTYLLDGEVGHVSALCSGYPDSWYACKALTIVYVAGFVLPDDENDCDLPEDIQEAAVALMRSFWRGKDRDPNLKEVTVEGVGSQSWWVDGSNATSLPPEVEDMLEPYRMPAV